MELTIAAAWQESQRKLPLHLLTEAVRRFSAASGCKHPDLAKLGVWCLEQLTGKRFIFPLNSQLSSCLAIQCTREHLIIPKCMSIKAPKIIMPSVHEYSGPLDGNGRTKLTSLALQGLHRGKSDFGQHVPMVVCLGWLRSFPRYPTLLVR
jgi:hypothetical protein